jgi:hypothetical protein
MAAPVVGERTRRAGTGGDFPARGGRPCGSSGPHAPQQAGLPAAAASTRIIRVCGTSRRQSGARSPAHPQLNATPPARAPQARRIPSKRTASLRVCATTARATWSAHTSTPLRLTSNTTPSTGGAARGPRQRGGRGSAGAAAARGPRQRGGRGSAGAAAARGPRQRGGRGSSAAAAEQARLRPATPGSRRQWRLPGSGGRRIGRVPASTPRPAPLSPCSYGYAAAPSGQGVVAMKGQDAGGRHGRAGGPGVLSFVERVLAWSAAPFGASKRRGAALLTPASHA